jgi:hypothetical protein
MKSDLRAFLPPSNGQLERFHKALHSDSGPGPGSEPFDRLMTGVKAARRLERFRSGVEHPASLRVLVDTICAAYGTDEASLASIMTVGKTVWRKALAGRTEPFKVSAARYARLARRFDLPLSLLRQALIGSYRLFMRQNLDMHVRFARSSARSRRREGYPRQMAAAFEELRAKSAAHRQAAAGDGAIDRFLAELEQCMS